jgi:hypothetical protein
LSSDGRYLFISGNRYDVLEGSDGDLVEESTPLGMTVVDTETWGVVDHPDLPFQFVRESGGVTIGVNTKSTSPWVDDVYMVSVDGEGTMAYAGPFTVEGGGCQPVRDLSKLVCSAYGDVSQTLRLIDTTTGEVSLQLEIGTEDYLDENGVLHDWAPSLEITGES